MSRYIFNTVQSRIRTKITNLIKILSLLYLYHLCLWWCINIKQHPVVDISCHFSFIFEFPVICKAYKYLDQLANRNGVESDTEH